MTDKVFYEELLPHEFEERISHKPVGYLPLGTLEWHGEHNALGADSIQSRGLFERAALSFGGIVFPPIWVAPDSISTLPNGRYLIGMDMAGSTEPEQQLPGSCYWVPKGLFVLLVESLLHQARRAGFRCMVADGHGPSRKAWAEMAGTWERQFDMALISAQRDFPPDVWKTQNDHAARDETSTMMALRPYLVDLSRLPTDRSIVPKGIGGADPRDSDREYGERLLGKTVEAIGRKLKERGF